MTTRASSKERIAWAGLITVLISLYVAAQVIADISAVKIVLMGSVIALPAGTFVYALTFTLTDLIQRRMAKRQADLLVITSGVINVLMALYFQWIINMEPAPFWSGQEAFASTLGIVWMIVAPSILAEVVSGLVDNWVYEKWRDHPNWAMVISNAVSVPMDSVLFAGLAFGALPFLFGGNPMPLAALGQMALGQTITKYVISAILMPAMRLMRRG